MASLWPSGGNKTNWRKIWAKKILYVIPSALLPNCHSFRITVIPSRLLSLLPDCCHSFRITVILSRLLSFLLDFYHSFLRNIVIPSKLFRQLQILTSSISFPYRPYTYSSIDKIVPIKISNIFFLCALLVRFCTPIPFITWKRTY